MNVRCAKCRRVFWREGVHDSSCCRKCRTPMRECSICGKLHNRRANKRCEDCIDAGKTTTHAGALIDGHTRYEDDVACQLFVAHFSGGATLEEVGEALGVTRERVRQIEDVALRRLRARMALVGIDIEDMAKKPAHPLAGIGGGW